jgi:tetratricopeptide (TPR) repeat protein
MSTLEVFERFYAMTANRFYSSAEQSRLLALAAASYGIRKNTYEFSSIYETVATVNRIGVDNLTDCKNFLLITDSLPGKKELINAVQAKKLYLERTGSSEYSRPANAVEWKTGAYRDQHSSSSAKLEVAYIEYARGNIESAAALFEKVADEDANLFALEYAGILCYEMQDYKEALYRFFTLESVLRGGLGIECPEGITALIEEIRGTLTDESIANARSRADRKVSTSYKFDNTSKKPIGF